MDSPVFPPVLPVRFLKFAFAASTVAYAVVIFVLKTVVLEGAKGGLVDIDPAQALLFSYVFLGLALSSFVLQFVLPSKVSPEGKGALLRLALCDSIGVFGLLLFLFTGSQNEAWLCCGVAFLAILFGERSKQTL